MEEPGCRSAVILISIVALIGSPFIGLIAAMAINGFHQQLGGPAVLTTAQGVGAVIGALSLAPLAHSFGQRRVVTAALFAFCLCLVLYGAAPGIWTAALAICLVGATYIGILSGLNSLIQLRAPEALRGRILGIYMMALGTVYPLGLIAEGAIGQAIGIRLMTVLSGALLLVVLALVAILAPGLFRALRPPAGDQMMDLATPEVAEVDLGGPVRSGD